MKIKKGFELREKEITGETIIPTLEFGCSINGYDGEIGEGYLIKETI